MAGEGDDDVGRLGGGVGFRFRIGDVIGFRRFAGESPFGKISAAGLIAGEEEAAHEGDRFLFGAQEQNRLVLRFPFFVGVECRLMRDGVLVDEGIQMKCFFEIGFRQDVTRAAVGEEVRIGEDDEARAPFGGHHEIVANHENRFAVVRKFAAEAEDFFLIE